MVHCSPTVTDAVKFGDLGDTIYEKQRSKIKQTVYLDVMTE